MAHPSERYVKFLLASSWGASHMTALDVGSFFEGLYLAPVQEKTYDRILVEFRPPEPFYFNNKKHQPSVKFMREQGLTDMWNPSDDVRRVLTSLINPTPVRDFVDMLLMGRMHPTDVAKFTADRFSLSVPYSAETIAAYAHYFWDVSNTSEKEWAELLRGHPRGMALMSAYRGGSEQALFRVGINPKMEDPKKPLREAYRQLAARLEALRFDEDFKGTIEIQSKLIGDLIRIYNILYAGLGENLDEVISKLREFILVTRPSDVKAFDKLVTEGAMAKAVTGEAATKLLETINASKPKSDG